jgi:peptidoglycan-associated lipoprotein
LLSGCAKQPATTTQASAPSPSGAPGAVGTPPARSQSTPPGTASRPVAGRTDGTSARPAPREFSETPALKDVHFDFDKYELRPGDTKVLDANAGWLKANAGHLLLIEGHADERGTDAYNLALGERRAQAAMNYLIAQGIRAGRVTIVSYGEERPACKEHTEACWARNRRDHFLTKAE